MSIDWNALKEIIPSLGISLGGLLLMTKSLYNTIDHSDVQPMHYLFILNSMLCFKNNIELNYADIMSSAVRRLSLAKKNISFLYLLEYMFDCGVKMFLISVCMSILIGVASNYVNIFCLVTMEEIHKNFVVIVSSVMVAFLAGICGSISTLISVIGCISLSLYFDYNPDNIVLPIIASSADYITTLSLSYFSKNIYYVVSVMYTGLFPVPKVAMSDMSKRVFGTNVVLSLGLFGILVFVYWRMDRRKTPRLFGVGSLLMAFAITATAGLTINLVADWNQWMALLIPFFNGLSGSIALIYSSQITSFVGNTTAESNDEVVVLDSMDVAEGLQEHPRSLQTLLTLLATALTFSFVAFGCIRLCFPRVPLTVVGLTCGFLPVNVFLLYHLTNLLVWFLGLFKIGASCHIVPLLNAASDLLGALVLGIVTYVLTYINK
ncbi:solute carrier family 41 [Nematocida homosporus]|uniref:solute carrier family 41 n=1 Tax=Nematocida homosporus TaxID=1912981 RepID=UPI00221FA63C|nr:solute carrier family 41 [Nematocida homosporus]KAI5187128.1 solute carrier family 41 [Nematocida homosporus]